MKYRLIALVLVTAAAAVFPVIAPADAVDEYIRSEQHRLRINGLGVAIVQGSRVRAKGYGTADLEAGVAVSPRTVFELGSLTKQFTSVAVLMLAEDGKLSLDDAILDRLSGLPDAWRGVTVRKLLAHTSGLGDYTEQSGFEQMRRQVNSPSELLKLVAGTGLERVPGMQFHYSNTNYLLLGMLIEKTSGRSYGDFLGSRIFRPLGMSQSRVGDFTEVIPHRARGYAWNSGRTHNAEYFEPANAFASGNLVSSLEDLVKWDQALSSGKLLHRASYVAMWSPSQASLATGQQYGFGWNIGALNGYRLLSHGGNISGFSSGIARFPDRKLSVIVLTNLSELNAEQLAVRIAGKADPLLAKPMHPIAADPDRKRTQRLRRVFSGMMNGEMNPEDFSDKLNHELGPLIRRDAAEAKLRAADFGSLESFQLLEAKVTAGGIDLQYLASYEYLMRAKVFVSLDESGRITNWGVAPAD